MTRARTTCWIWEGSQTIVGRSAAMSAWVFRTLQSARAQDRDLFEFQALELLELLDVGAQCGLTLELEKTCELFQCLVQH